MISLDTRGDWSNTLNFFDKMLRQDYISAVEAQARRGVAEDGYAGMETEKALQAQLGQGRI